MIYIIKDWAGNTMFKGKRFKSFEDAWEYIYENVPDEEMYQDLYVSGYRKGTV